jgi:asparagine N-glycosylation enzyme membrane subunit Stt3
LLGWQIGYAAACRAAKGDSTSPPSLLIIGFVMEKRASSKKQTKDFFDRYELMLVIMLIASGVIIRAIPLMHQGFYESDVYFHYVVLKEAVSNNFIVPSINPLSDRNGLVFEPKGFYYLTLVPYYFVRNLISLYSFLRIIPLFYVILEFILFYIFAGQLIKNSKFQLLALFLLVFSISNISRTSALTYRGDGFIGMFFLASLILLALAYKSKKNNYVYALGSVFALIICGLVWNGSTFAFAVFAISVVAIAFYSFFANNTNLKHKRILKISLIILAVFALAIVLGTYFSNTALYLYFQNGIGSKVAYLTVSELQPVNPSIIIGSNGLVSIITPLFYPILISSIVPLAYKWIPFLIILAVIPIYIIANLKKKNEESTEVKIIVLSYFAITAFLSVYAVRFLTILSIPAAIIEAYTLYWICTRIKSKYAIIGLIAFVLIIQALAAIVFVYGTPFPSTVNNQFIEANDWINLNLPTNATIITYWNFGAEVEFYTNRTATEDSIGNQFTNNTYQLWLMSTNSSISSLGKLNASYLMFRYDMMGERRYICLEALAYNCTASYVNSTSTNIYKIDSNQTINGLTILYSNNDTRIYRLN